MDDGAVAGGDSLAGARSTVAVPGEKQEKGVVVQQPSLSIALTGERLGKL